MMKTYRSDQKYNMELIVAAFEENYQKILDYLPLNEQQTVKLSNHPLI